MAVRILTDTASEYDCSRERDPSVIMVPMSLTYGDETLLDGVEIDRTEFYRRLVQEKRIPVTSQPSPDQFLTEFQKAKEAGDCIVAILISGALSGTVQSARLASQMVDYEEIYIVDSLTATAGIAILTDVACFMVRQGKSGARIAEELEALKHRVRVLAVVDTLEYLYKGGRLTRAEAGLGTLVNIKPVIRITEDGKVGILAKSIGRKRACRQLLELVQERKMDERYTSYFLYSENQENCQNFVTELNKRVPIGKEAAMVEIGATIGTHIGGGAFGIAFIEAE